MPVNPIVSLVQSSVIWDDVNNRHVVKLTGKILNLSEIAVDYQTINTVFIYSPNSNTSIQDAFAGTGGANLLQVNRSNDTFEVTALISNNYKIRACVWVHYNDGTDGEVGYSSEVTITIPQHSPVDCLVTTHTAEYQSPDHYLMNFGLEITNWNGSVSGTQWNGAWVLSTNHNPLIEDYEAGLNNTYKLQETNWHPYPSATTSIGGILNIPAGTYYLRAAVQMTYGTGYEAWGYSPEVEIVLPLPKTDQDPPSTPVASEITANSIKWTSDIGSKIVCNDETKDSGSVWSNLNEGALYTAYAYLPSDDTHNQSPNSSNGSATTLVSIIPQDAPSAPVVSEITKVSMKWTSDNGSKIVCNLQEKDSGSIWYGLQPDTTYTAYAYLPSDPTHSQSPNSAEVSAMTLTAKIGTSKRSPKTPMVTIAPAPPVASAVTISSENGFIIGNKLTGSYVYKDVNTNPESGSIATWYKGETPTGPWIPILSTECTYDTTLEYTLTSNELRQYIRLGIVPKNLVPPTTGIEVYSDSTVQINALQTPPEALNVKIQKKIDGIYQDISNSSECLVGDNLLGVFDYYDINDDPKGQCIYRWWRSKTDDPNGEYEMILKEDGSPVTDITYIVRDIDIKRYIEFEVTPVSL